METQNNYTWSTTYKGAKLDMLRADVLALHQYVDALYKHLGLRVCAGGEVVLAKKKEDAEPKLP
jgi:hypothetical protein